jgi:hypothetical protein
MAKTAGDRICSKDASRSDAILEAVDRASRNCKTKSVPCRRFDRDFSGKSSRHGRVQNRQCSGFFLDKEEG